MFLRRSIRKRRGDGERGQSLVEFALIVPIFLILVFAIVDFGMGFHAWITVTNSAREGARLGAIGAPGTGACDFDPGTPADNITCRVRETADTLDQSNLTVAVTNAQGDPGESVVVEADYQYDLITPLAGLIAFVSGDTMPTTLTFASTADMRLE